MKNKTSKAVEVKKIIKAVDTSKAIDKNKEFYVKAKTLLQCSRYTKEEKLTLSEVKKYIDASLEVLADYREYLKDYKNIESNDYKKIRQLIKSMYDKKIDFNNKNYKRIERVFSSLVAKKLNLSTSTCHEKLTESCNLANRELIKSFFSYSDNQLDSIRVLVYKFKI